MYGKADLSPNKSLWNIIKKSPKLIGDVFKKFNFPPVDYYKHFTSYQSEYNSPYGLNIYDIGTIYRDPTCKNIPEGLKELIFEYWDNVQVYFRNIAELRCLGEELRRLEREEMWGK